MKKPRHNRRGPQGRRPPTTGPRPSAEGPPRGEAEAHLGLKRLDANRFVLEPPDTALDRAEDIDEVRTMIAGGELDIARDELLYLVGDCRGFLEAHNLLGELALEEDDVALARGHFGFAYEVALDSLPQGFRGRLPAKEGYNAHFFLAGRGLARCLIARGQADRGREVLEQLNRLDPEEPHVRSLLAELAERAQSP